VRPEAIIVPLDGTEQALAALPVARSLADAFHATLHVVYVGERALPSRTILSELGLDAEEVKGFVVEQRTGPPAEEILRFAAGRRDPLLVLCTHTDTAKPRGTLGGIAEHLLVHAPCGVVLVEPERGRQPWSLRRILLPHDGTPTTAAAMDPAGDLAELTGAEVLVLHVAAPGAPPPVEPGTLTAPRYLDQPQHEWPAWAAEFLGRMCALGHPPSEVRFRLVMAAGEPGEEIVRVARQHESDLIVLAWHGVWEAEHALTMKEVIRRAPCPVLVVRAGLEGGQG
jgi:nucleotide-binding universal stress UspA family protein